MIQKSTKPINMYIDHGCTYPEKEMRRGISEKWSTAKNDVAKKYASNYIFL